MNELRFIRLLIVTCFFSASVCNAQTLMIDSCYFMAKRNYPLIKQYELLQKSNEYSISNANKAYFPQLNITGIGGYIFGGIPNLGPASNNGNENFKFIGLAQLNQVIWDGGSISAQKKVINAQSEIEKSNVDVQLYALKERINQLYFGILLIDEQIKQIDMQIDMLNHNVKRIELMHDNGYALKSELNELKAEVLKVKQHRIEFEYSRKGYVYMLSLFLGQQLNDSVTFLRPLVSLTADQKNSRPELLLFQNQQKLADAQLSVSKASLMPKLGILGAGVLISPGINLGMEKKTTLAVAGLALSWNIGGLYSNGSNKSLTEVKIDMLKSQEETFLFNNNIQSLQTNAEIEKCKVILSSDDEIINLRSSVRESYQLQYENGRSSLFEVISATDKETEARSNKALHDIQLLLAIYQFKTNSGN
jgi:outer membrane protein TolC